MSECCGLLRTVPMCSYIPGLFVAKRIPSGVGQLSKSQDENWTIPGPKPTQVTAGKRQRGASAIPVLFGATATIAKSYLFSRHNKPQTQSQLLGINGNAAATGSAVLVPFLGSLHGSFSQNGIPWETGASTLGTSFQTETRGNHAQDTHRNAMLKVPEKRGGILAGGCKNQSVSCQQTVWVVKRSLLPPWAHYY